MFLIVGLGNPGDRYSETRHNVGFMTLDKLAKRNNINIDIKKSRFKGMCGEGYIQEQKVILLKPLTYMNLSGESIVEVANWYKISSSCIIIIYDDVDLKSGDIRVRKSGGSGTHNGMKSVILNLNTQYFPRVRVGIGTSDSDKDLAEYVLKKMTKGEYEVIEKGINHACDAVETILGENIEIAMNKYN
jgi:peptidyl-tRNA hydrolase